MEPLAAKFWKMIYSTPLGWFWKQMYYRVNLLLRGERDPNEYIIDKKRELIFLVLSKNATTSIKRSFLSEDERKHYGDSYAIHRTQALKKRRKIPKKCQHFYSFCIIRNPFTRLVSLYESKFINDQKKGEGFYYAGNSQFHLSMTFSEFAYIVCQTPDHLSDRHFRSQAFSITKFWKDLDYVWKLEDMPQAFQPLIDRWLSPLDISNKSKKGWIQKYFTIELLDRVYERYRDDITLGGYESFYNDLRKKLVGENH